MNDPKGNSSEIPIDRIRSLRLLDEVPREVSGVLE